MQLSKYNHLMHTFVYCKSDLHLAVKGKGNCHQQHLQAHPLKEIRWPMPNVRGEQRSMGNAMHAANQTISCQSPRSVRQSNAAPVAILAILLRPALNANPLAQYNTSTQISRNQLIPPSIQWSTQLPKHLISIQLLHSLPYSCEQWIVCVASRPKNSKHSHSAPLQ